MVKIGLLPPSFLVPFTNSNFFKFQFFGSARDHHRVRLPDFLFDLFSSFLSFFILSQFFRTMLTVSFEWDRDISDQAGQVQRTKQHEFKANACSLSREYFQQTGPCGRCYVRFFWSFDVIKQRTLRQIKTRFLCVLFHFLMFLSVQPNYGRRPTIGRTKVESMCTFRMLVVSDKASLSVLLNGPRHSAHESESLDALRNGFGLSTFSLSQCSLASGPEEIKRNFPGADQDQSKYIWKSRSRIQRTIPRESSLGQALCQDLESIQESTGPVRSHERKLWRESFFLFLRWFEELGPICEFLEKASKIGVSEIKSPVGRVFQKYVYIRGS